MKLGRKTKILFTAIGVGLLLTTFPANSPAEVPGRIHHEGYLTNSGGTPVNDTLSLTFSIYDIETGGTALWTEIQNLAITDGAFQVQLGEMVPFDLPFDQQYYLSIKVGESSEMVPRFPLSSVPYSLRAKVAESVIDGGSGGSSLSSADGIYQNVVNVSNDGNVGIGTADPEYALDLESNATTRFLQLNRDSATDKRSVITWAQQDTDLYYLVMDNGVTNTGTLEFNQPGVGSVLAMDANGNVGIGTNTPEVKLHVKGSDTDAAQFNLPEVRIINNNPRLTILDTSGGSVWSVRNQNGWFRIVQDIETLGSTRFIIDDTGNVGIGTTQPGAKLHVQGTYSDSIDGFSTKWSYSGSGNGMTTGLLSTVRNPYLQGHRFVDDIHYGQSLLLNPFGGDVGIGTTTPGARLEIDSGEANTSLILNSSGDGYVNLEMKDNTTTYPITLQKFGNDLRINPDGGTVSIGTTTPDPSSLLHVNGNVLLGAGTSTAQIEAGIIKTKGSWDFIIDANANSGDSIQFKGSDTAQGDTDLMTIRENGYVGIGNTSHQTARTRLAIKSRGNDMYPLALERSSDSSFLMYFFERPDGTSQFGMKGATDTDMVNIKSNGDSFFNGGNVGIGTTLPNVKLDVNSQGTNISANFESTDSLALISFTDDSTTDSPLMGAAGNDAVFFVGTEASRLEAMRIKNDGKIGIGTANPTHQLSVNGTIQAKEIIVETGWADYVFKDDYHLRALTEIEENIKEFGHLPGMPSEREVRENGVSLGKMQTKLLEKVEELTLYMIEQDKMIKQLKTKVASLEAGL